jgi:hypothetical protein
VLGLPIALRTAHTTPRTVVQRTTIALRKVIDAGGIGRGLVRGGWRFDGWWLRH